MYATLANTSPFKRTTPIPPARRKRSQRYATMVVETKRDTYVSSAAATTDRLLEEDDDEGDEDADELVSLFQFEHVLVVCVSLGDSFATA